MKGEHSKLKDADGVLEFTRSFAGKTMLCMFNMTDDVKDVELPAGNWTAIGKDLGAADFGNSTTVRLEAWQPLLAQKS